MAAMKKILTLLLLLSAIVPLSAAYNPFFGGGADRQIAANFGFWGVNSGVLLPTLWKYAPFAMVHLQYSLPTTFFKLPARNSVNAMMTIGYGKKDEWDYRKFSVPIVFLQEDVAIFYGRKWYLGNGIGTGFQAHENERIGSKLIFSFKTFFGYRFSDSFGGEIFAQHISNGSVAENKSYAWYGLGILYNF
jgi:hypothetical protein